MTENRFYSRKVLELFLDPPNTGVARDFNGKGEAVNPACSDQVSITVRVHRGIVEEVRFQTQGCAAAIAASAATTLLVQGRSVDEARLVDKDKVVEFLEGLPAAKIGCSVIAPEALQLALANATG